mmetsp:Transcript_27534/g.74931  ORF Transcript_27534/g.74931 Transcript_27534/m.74931 type:complete len:223 (-) Transcript_27534:195-863(-)
MPALFAILRAALAHVRNRAAARLLLALLAVLGHALDVVEHLREVREDAQEVIDAQQPKLREHDGFDRRVALAPSVGLQQRSLAEVLVLLESRHAEDLAAIHVDEHLDAPGDDKIHRVGLLALDHDLLERGVERRLHVEGHVEREVHVGPDEKRASPAGSAGSPRAPPGHAARSRRCSKCRPRSTWRSVLDGGCCAKIREYQCGAPSTVGGTACSGCTCRASA